MGNIRKTPVEDQPKPGERPLGFSQRRTSSQRPTTDPSPPKGPPPAGGQPMDQGLFRKLSSRSSSNADNTVSGGLQGQRSSEEPTTSKSGNRSGGEVFSRPSQKRPPEEPQRDFSQELRDFSQELSTEKNLEMLF